MFVCTHVNLLDQACQSPLLIVNALIVHVSYHLVKPEDDGGVSVPVEVSYRIVSTATGGSDISFRESNACILKVIDPQVVCILECVRRIN